MTPVTTQQVNRQTALDSSATTAKKMKSCMGNNSSLAPFFSLPVIYSRRKTLCFSCRDIRRHPCLCANTRANIGLSTCGEGENIFCATAYNISRSSAREVSYPNIHLSAQGRRCPPWKKPTSFDCTPQQNRKNSFARPSAAAGSSTTRLWLLERAPTMTATRSAATTASNCCPG